MATLARPLIISTGALKEDALAGEVAIVTGAGGGIGLEAARSLLWLGATVVIAEVDAAAGRAAQAQLAASAGDRVLFVATDVGDEKGVGRLVETVDRRFHKVDAVLNNATYAPAGMTVTETPVEAWDRSYAVNLRGPALLAGACLPGMIRRRHGAFVCVSSTGGPYLAAYEALKAAQVALAGSLDAELGDCGVHAFTIGPGLVPTATATDAIAKLAPRLGTTVEDFWVANRAVVISVEAAGAGFAAAIALAARYTGQEISSSQALADAGIDTAAAGEARPVAPGPDLRDLGHAARACARVRQTLTEQAAGWQQRSFFERQWMQRDFRQHVGMPVERCLETLERTGDRLAAGDLPGAIAERAPVDRLAAFYEHLGQLAAGYVKDPELREEQLGLTAGWKAEVDRLAAELAG